MTNRKAQQEIVGFVLIVVLVVIGMMVFLVISLKNDRGISEESLKVKNMLDSIMGYTTDCAIVFEPQYQTIEDLFKSSFEYKNCNNKNKPAKEYLNETLINILDSLIQSEATIKGYSLDFLQKDDQGESGLLQISVGECKNNMVFESAQRNLLSGSNRLIIRLKLCIEN